MNMYRFYLVIYVQIQHSLKFFKFCTIIIILQFLELIMKYIFIAAYFFSSAVFAGHCSAGASHDEELDENHSEMTGMKSNMKDKMKSMKESEEDNSAEEKKESDKNV